MLWVGCSARFLFAGGAVRDRLLGIESEDYDIEVHGLALEALDEVAKGLDVLEAPVHGCEADVGDLIQRFEAFHDLLADDVGFQLAIRASTPPRFHSAGGAPQNPISSSSPGRSVAIPPAGISTFASQQQAFMGGIFFILPAVLLSGTFTPVRYRKRLLRATCPP